MTQRSLLLAAVLCASCAKPERPLKDALPVQVSAWTLGETNPLPSEETPAALRTQGLQRAIAANYTGPVKIAVRVYEMRSEPGAFEAMQKWRQSDGMARYKGAYFVVAESSEAERAVVGGFLREFVEELE